MEVLADDGHEHLWSLRRICRFFWPQISSPPFHEIPAPSMEVSVDDGVETASSGVSSSHVVDSVHPPSPEGWADIPPARVHFMCINKKNSYGPFDHPCADLMKNEGFTYLSNVLFIRLLFNISSLP